MYLNFNLSLLNQNMHYINKYKLSNVILYDWNCWEIYTQNMTCQI